MKILQIIKARKVLSVIIIFAMIALGFTLTRKKSEKENLPPVSVATEVVKKDTISIKLTVFGKIRSSESVTLSSEIVGRIVYLKKDGSFVQKNDLIVQLDSCEAEGQYMRALGRKNEEEVRLKTTEELFKEGYKTENHLNEQRAKHQTALGELKQAQAQLNRHNIRAPFSGIIGLQNQSVGTTVNQHTKLVTVTNLNNLQVEFTISDTEIKNLGGIDKIKDGEIFLILDGAVFAIPAKFSASETVVDAETSSVCIRANLIMDKGQVLAVPGQSGKVVLNLGVKENVLTVPVSAVEKQHGMTYVIKIVNDIAVETLVKTGAQDDERVEILEGLKEGDLVVINGQFGVTDGQKVIVEK